MVKFHLLFSDSLHLFSTVKLSEYLHALTGPMDILLSIPGNSRCVKHLGYKPIKHSFCFQIDVFIG